MAVRTDLVFWQERSLELGSLPASLHAMLGDSAQNDLDVIMRCALRLLPLLERKSFVPIIYWYLANRTGDANWQYAFGDCRLDVLAKTITADITGKDVVDQPMLCGLVRLCLWSQDFMAILHCESVLAVVERRHTTAAGPASAAAKAILTAKVLVGLESKIRAGNTEANPNMPDIQLMQEIESHPLLRDSQSFIMDPLPSSIAFPDQLLRFVADRYASEFIRFLSACSSPALLSYEAETTIKYSRRSWEPFLAYKRMSVDMQREIAQAVSKLVECACDDAHPQQATTHAIVQCLCEHLDPDGKLADNFTDPESAAILVQAMDRASSDFGVRSPVPTSPIGPRAGRAFTLDIGDQDSPIVHLSTPWANGR
ncbi:hypothetical protein K438DRAFT_1836099 [Mycena galopus ATCC 62051]|nr:hypothetical protein K438DRAFT_1836099 [Mycena galopus ATCC 62051]